MSKHLHPGPHLDADQLSAFAEGALPEHERLLCMAHLADCPQCREVAFLAQEPVEVQAETVFTIEDAPEPFWRRWLSPIPFAGFAAALACGLALFVTLHPHPPAPVQVGRATLPSLLPAPLPSATAPPAPVAEKQMDTMQRTEPSRAAAAPPPPAMLAPRPSAAPAPQASRQMLGSVTDEATASPMIGGTLSSVPAVPAAAPKPAAAPELAAMPPKLPAASAMDSIATKNNIPVGQPATAAGTEVANLPVQARALRKLSSAAPAAITPENGPLHLQIQHNALNQTSLSEASGTVSDGSGAVIPGATVTVKSLLGGTSQQAKTDSAGKFAIPALQPGKYQVQIAAQGFVQLAQQVDLQARDLVTMASVLPAGAVSQSVEVTNSATATLSVQAASVAGLVTENACVLTLPGNAHVSSCAQEGDKTIALDDSGTLFFRRGSGRWKKIKPHWDGRAVIVAELPCPAVNHAVAAKASAVECAAVFQVSTDTNTIWTSNDGQHWHQK